MKMWSWMPVFAGLWRVRNATRRHITTWLSPATCSPLLPLSSQWPSQVVSSAFCVVSALGGGKGLVRGCWRGVVDQAKWWWWWWGFFLACEDSGKMFDNSFPGCAFFFCCLVEISSCKLIPLFRPGSVHSGLLRWLWPSVLWWVACELVFW